MVDKKLPNRSFGESETRIIPKDLIPMIGITIEQRMDYLEKFKDVSLIFSPVQKSLAWPMVNALIGYSDEKKSSHLFQVNHAWGSLLREEVTTISDLWGKPALAVEADPMDFLNTFMKRDGSIKSVSQVDNLSADEYIARRQQLSSEMGIPWQDMDQNRVFRKHIFSTRGYITYSCVCHALVGESNAGSVCAACGTKVLKDAQLDQSVDFREDNNPSDDVIASSLALPYPFSYFEFVINGHYWLVECIEQEDKSAVLKFYFHYENQWLQVTRREYMESKAVFTAIKEQVIGALIALEAKAARKYNHENARTPPTPAMMERLKKVFKQEFNFGYSVIDLTKRSGGGSSVVSDDYQPKVRLHFRRGHWRVRLGKHIRVKWCIVGDPSLGFVDKHYRF